MSPQDFLTTRLLSNGAKLAVFGEPLVDAGDSPVEESVATFVRRRFNQEILDYVANPFVAGIFAGDPEQLSVRHALPKLHGLERTHGSVIKAFGGMMRARKRDADAAATAIAGGMVSFRTGLQELPDALGARAARRDPARGPGHPAALGAQGVDGRRRVPGGRAVRRRHLRRAGALRRRGRPRLSRPATASRRSPASPTRRSRCWRSASAARTWPTRSTASASWCPRSSGATCSASSSPPRSFRAARPTATCCSPRSSAACATPTSPTPTCRRSPRGCMDDLRLLLGARGEPTFRAFHLWPKAIPQYDLTYGRFKDIMDEAERRNPGFALAGSYREGVAARRGDRVGRRSGERGGRRCRPAAGRRPVSAPLRVGTRGSALALWQTEHVRARLHAAGYETERVEIRTTGDMVQDVPLAQIGSRALFTRQIDDAMLEGRIDLAVHSLKDLPTELPDGIALVARGRAGGSERRARGPRADRSGTTCPRARCSRPAASAGGRSCFTLRPDLQVRDIRGNVDTRLAKLDANAEWSAILLATAGLVRLGLGDRIGQRLPPEMMLPAPGQGALAVTARAGDRPAAAAAARAVHHAADRARRRRGAGVSPHARRRLPGAGRGARGARRDGTAPAARPGRLAGWRARASRGCEIGPARGRSARPTTLGVRAGGAAAGGRRGVDPRGGARRARRRPSRSRDAGDRRGHGVSRDVSGPGRGPAGDSGRGAKRRR